MKPRMIVSLTPRQQAALREAQFKKHLQKVMQELEHGELKWYHVRYNFVTNLVLATGWPIALFLLFTK